ncbi:hypothetical protein BH18ACT12_BH18ACT12_22830 [soil metagenome]
MGRDRAFTFDAEAHLPEELARALAGVEEIDLVVHAHLHVDHVVLGDVVVHEAQLAVPASPT